MKMKKTGLIFIVFILSITKTMADDVVKYEESSISVVKDEPAVETTEIVEATKQPAESTAVSRVMERFSSIRATPKEENIVEEHVEEAVLESDSSLEIINPIQTAKFETKDIPYVYPTDASDEHPQNTLPKKVTVSKIDKDKESSKLLDLEKETRKIIALEMAKVQKVEKEALEKISKAVKAFKEAQAEEKSF